MGFVLVVLLSSGYVGECGYEKCWGVVVFGYKGCISYSFGKWLEWVVYREVIKFC